jgi:hypothetical protein
MPLQDIKNVGRGMRDVMMTLAEATICIDGLDPREFNAAACSKAGPLCDCVIVSPPAMVQPQFTIRKLSIPRSSTIFGFFDLLVLPDFWGVFFGSKFSPSEGARQ